MIGEGKRAGDISRPPIADAVNAGLQRVAPSAAKRIGEPPIGATAGKRKADDGVRADVIIHAGRETESVCRDIIGADAGVAIRSVAGAVSCARPSNADRRLAVAAPF